MSEQEGKLLAEEREDPRDFFFSFFFLVEVELIYNIIYTSGVQHSDSQF